MSEGARLTEAEILREAAAIELRLRERGIPADKIPPILGSAFVASVIDLPPYRRLKVLAAHYEALDAVIADIMAVAERRQ
jgi:hypothetical protein